jgi:hypothetical protein
MERFQSFPVRAPRSELEQKIWERGQASEMKALQVFFSLPRDSFYPVVRTMPASVSQASVSRRLCWEHHWHNFFLSIFEYFLSIDKDL